MGAKSSQGGKSRKKGRNMKACAAYRNSQTRERNKTRRLLRHLKRFPDDAVASICLKGLPKFNRLVA